MNKSETISKLSAALSKAQAEMSGAKKTAKNPFFKSNYANLEEVINCLKEPFANNGLSFVQFPITQDGFAGVETVLMHESGDWISSEFLLKCAKNDPQGMGSAITYARRYGLQSAAGVPSEDDDGNSATMGSTPAPTPAPTPKKAPEVKMAEVVITGCNCNNGLYTVTIEAGGKTTEAKTTDKVVGGLAEFNKGGKAKVGLQQTAKGIKLASMEIL